MKFFSAVLIVIVSAVLVKSMDPNEKKKMMMKIVSDCKTSSGASDDDIAKLMIHAKPSSKEGKCMFSCIMENFGVVKAGQLDTEGLNVWGKSMNAPADVIQIIIDACKGETDPDPCESAFKIGYCLKTNGAKHKIIMDI